MSQFPSATLRIQPMGPDAILPVMGAPDSIGLDCFANMACDYVLDAGFRVEIPLGFSAGFPQGTYGRLVGRIGLAHNHGIHILADTIDPTFAGEISVVLLNTGNESFVVERGMRLCQLLLQMALTPVVEVVVDMTP